MNNEKDCRYRDLSTTAPNLIPDFQKHWFWIWIYTSQKPINGYKRDGTGRAQQLFLYKASTST